MLAGLANENRLCLFLVLLARDACVCELQAILDMEQSRLSHQLQTLRFLGLVEAKQEGHWIVYSVPDEVKKNPIVQAIKKTAELPHSLKERMGHVRIRGIKKHEKLESRRRRRS